jgi:hypothetical protein
MNTEPTDLTSFNDVARSAKAALRDSRLDDRGTLCPSALVLAQCDGGWQHQNGVEINTLDNPSWRIVINLAGTELAGAAFAAVEENYDHDTDWLRCWIAG